MPSSIRPDFTRAGGHDGERDATEEQGLLKHWLLPDLIAAVESAILSPLH